MRRVYIRTATKINRRTDAANQLVPAVNIVERSYGIPTAVEPGINYPRGE